MFGPGNASLFIVEKGNGRVTAINPGTGAFQTHFGTGMLSQPLKATTDATHIFITDSGNNRIVRYTLAGFIPTIMANGLRHDAVGHRVGREHGDVLRHRRRPRQAAERRADGDASPRSASSARPSGSSRATAT